MTRKTAPGGVMGWDAFVALLIEHLSATERERARDPTYASIPELRRAHKEQYEWRLKVVRSPGFRKAFQGQGEGSADEFIGQAVQILICLANIQRLVPYRDDPAALVWPVEAVSAARSEAITHLRVAAALLCGPEHRPDLVCAKYGPEIASLIERVSSEKAFHMTLGMQFASQFDPRNLKRKGGAAKPGGAFNGWMVKELARYIPKSAPKRDTAISELLALVDVHVEPSSVTNTLLRAAKT